MFSSTALNWIVVCLVAGTVASAVLTAVAWHRSRQPFYLLNQRSAEFQLQSSIVVTLILILFTILAVGTARFQTAIVEASGAVEEAATPTPPATQVRTVAQLVTATPTFEATATRSPTTTPVPTQPPPSFIQERPPSFTLPEVYGSVPLKVPTGPESTLSNIVFATRLFPNRRPANPEPYFTTDIQTLYATFEYRNMADDMAWSWVWRKGGKVVDGGNMYWSFGRNGPAYVYLEPSSGFEAGIYSAELWLNNQLIQEAEIELYEPDTVVKPDKPVVVVTTPEVFRPPFNRIKDLPPVYNQAEPRLELTDLTRLEILDFGLEMTALEVDTESGLTSGFAPVALAASFQHNAMEPGMSWSWVWRLENEIIGGGNQLWSYNGNESRGLIHLLPEAVEAGEYSLELWVNGIQMSRAVLNVTSGP